MKKMILMLVLSFAAAFNIQAQTEQQFIDELNGEIYYFKKEITNNSTEWINRMKDQQRSQLAPLSKLKRNSGGYMDLYNYFLALGRMIDFVYNTRDGKTKWTEFFYINTKVNGKLITVKECVPGVTVAKFIINNRLVVMIVNDTKEPKYIECNITINNKHFSKYVTLSSDAIQYVTSLVADEPENVPCIVDNITCKKAVESTNNFREG